MAKHFNSEFSGAQIDEAVRKVLHGTGAEYGHIILDCSESSKINLNDVIAVNTYSIAYYTNSYDDSSTITPIVLTVTKINDVTLEQRYSIGDMWVHRYFDAVTATFSDWDQCDMMASNLVSVESDELITVKQPTLVFRKVSKSTNTGGSTGTNTEQAVMTASVVVDSVPDPSTAEPNTVYFVLSDDTDGNNKYDEYMLINGSMELIGSSASEIEQISDEEILDILES